MSQPRGGLGISYFQGLPTALGRATTLYTNVARLAGMFSGLLFGLAQVLGYRYAYVGSLALCVIGTAVLALASRRPAHAGRPTGRAALA